MTAGTLRRIDATGVPLLAARAVLGGMFVWLGTNKIAEPINFLKLIREYGIVPEDMPVLLNGMAVALPWLEIWCGVLLLLGLAVRGVGSSMLLLLAVFSVLFPTAKLVASRVGLADIDAGRPLNRLHRVLANVGKYSMADVFVVALLVVASKTFPGGTEVHVQWGVYAFAASALLTVFVAARVQSSMPRASVLVSR